MIYYTDYCFNAYDLYEKFNATSLKISRKTVTEKYGYNKKRWICASVFIYCCFLILLDIIENNITFVLPLLNGKHAYIHTKAIIGEDLKQARQSGAYADIDLLNTGFTSYRLTYCWKNKTGLYEKPIYISKKFKDVFHKYINEGKQYH